jgi:phage-related protein
MGGFQSKMKTIGSSLATFGGTLVKGAFIGAGVAISGLGGAIALATKEGMQMNAFLELSTLQFTTLMGDADAAKKHVEGLFKIAAETPFEASEIIGASKSLLTFGGAALNTTDNINLVGDAAAATGSNIGEVANWFGRAYSSIQAGRPFGESAQRLQEMGILTADSRNKLEDMQKAGASTEEVWAEMNKTFGEFNDAMKLQAGTQEGLISTIKDNLKMGLGTAFKPLFDAFKTGLSKFAEFTSSDKFKILVDKLGLVVQSFADIINAFSQGGLSGVFDTLKEGSPIISNLLQSFSNMDIGGILQTAFAGVSMAAILAPLGMGLSAGIVPLLSGIAPILGAGISGVLWKGWLLAIPKLAGPLTTLLSSKFGGIFLSGLSKAIPLFAKFSGFATFLTPLAGALSTIVIPLLLISVAVLGVVGAFALFKEGKLDKYINPLKDAFASISATFQQMLPFLKQTGATLAGAFMSAAKALAEKIIPFLVTQVEKFSKWFADNRPLIEAFITALVNFFVNTLLPAIVGFWDIVQPLLGGFVDLVLGIAKIVMQVVTGDWKGAWDTAKKTLSKVWEAIKKALLAALNWIANLMGGSLAEIKKQWSDNWNQLKLICATIWNNIKTAIATKIQEIKTSISNKMTEIKTNITEKWNEIKTNISNKLQEIYTNIVAKWNEIKTAIENKLTEIYNTIVQKWMIIKTAITAKLIEIVNSVIAKWNEIKTAIENKLAEIITKVIEWGTNLKTKIGDAIQSAIDWVKEKISAFKDLGSEIIANIITGLENSFQDLIDWLTKLITDLIAGLLGGGGAGIMGLLGGLSVPLTLNPTMGGGLPSGFTTGQFAAQGRGGYSNETTNYFQPQITVVTGINDPKKAMRGFI